MAAPWFRTAEAEAIRQIDAAVARSQRAADVAHPAEPARPAPTATGAPKPTRKATSKLGAFADRLGVLPDREVAAMAGLTPTAVTNYRLRPGIPSANARAKPAVPSASPTLPVVPASAEPAPTPDADADVYAWTVTIVVGGEEHERLIVAAGMVEAGDIAVRGAERLGGEVTRIRRSGLAFVAAR
jgi:hypothetical protein